MNKPIVTQRSYGGYGGSYGRPNSTYRPVVEWRRLPNPELPRTKRRISGRLEWRKPQFRRRSQLGWRASLIISHNILVMGDASKRAAPFLFERDEEDQRAGRVNHAMSGADALALLAFLVNPQL